MDYSIFENMRIGIMIVAQDTGDVLYVNNWIKEIAGLSGNDQEPGDWTKYFSPEHMEILTNDPGRQLEEKGWFRTESRVSINGRTLWLDSGCSFLPDGEKKLLCVTLTDITDIRQIENNLTRITQTIPGGLVIIRADEDMSLCYANAGYYTLLGYTKEAYLKATDNKAVRTLYDEDRDGFIKSMYEQISENGRFQMEGRLVKGSGDTVWFSFDGLYVREEEVFYCILVDITRQKDAILKLEMEQKFNQIVFGLSSDILFNLDLRTRIVTHSENVMNRLGLKFRAGKFPQCILDSGIVISKDIPAFMAMAGAMYEGRKITTELHLTCVDGSVGCYSVEYDFLYGGDNEPIRAVGKITNITGQKNLEKRASLDALTHLYNKAESRRMIEESLRSGQKESRHAFMIVDIDDFKSVNDTLGHHFGDMVLVDIARKIRTQFTKQAITGRIGGDEFVIFLKDIQSADQTIEKAMKLADAFRHTFSGEHHNYKISGSIGIAFYPQQGQDYETLYRNADRAMYASKRRGKDQFTIYSDSLPGYEFITRRTKEEPERRQIKGSEEKVIFNVFDLLYETKDIQISVNKVLEIAGREFDVDRCYIFEAGKDGEIYDNTFEWCREGIEPQIDRLQGLKRTELEYALTQYDYDGIFICSDLEMLGEELSEMLRAQGIKSMLHCCIRRDGIMKILAGFDDCSNHRRWGDAEITALSYISKLLGMYLL